MYLLGNMFWFFYRWYNENRWIVWNGKEETLQYVFDKNEAIERYKNVKNNFKKVEIKRPPNKIISFDLPIDETSQAWEDTSIADFLSQWKIELRLKQLLQEILKYYYIDNNWFFVERKKASTLDTKEDTFWVFAMMKDILLWCFRLKNVLICTGKDNWGQDIFNEVCISQDYRNVKYIYKWKEHTTNLLWIYAPQLRKTLFPWTQFEFQKQWYTLQKWQRHLDFYRWFRTYIYWARDSWKSAYASADLAKWIFKTRVNSMELDENTPFDFHIINRTIDAWQMGKYMKKMFERLIPWAKWFVDYISTNKHIKMRDWNEERYIRRWSQNSTDFRWHRGIWTIADEFWFYDNPEAVSVAQGSSNMRFLWITTVRRDSKKHWTEPFYDNAFVKMQSYMPMEERVYNTRHEYWFNECNTIRDYEKKIYDWTFEKIFKDYKKQFPEVAFRYTIDDQEILTEEEKKEIIMTKLNQFWEDYVLAEYYWERSNSISIFNAEHLVEAKLPNRFHHYILAYDHAETADNPWRVEAGIFEDKLYIVKAEKLARWDIDNRRKRMKERVQRLRNEYWEANITFVCDITSNFPLYREISDKVGYIDVPVSWSRSTHNDMNVNKTTQNAIGRVQHNVWRKYIIELTLEEFFNKGKIFFSNECTNEWGIIDEIAWFKMRKDGKRIEWEKKMWDDLVFWMFLCVYVAYNNYIRPTTMEMQNKTQMNNSIIEEVYEYDDYYDNYR